MICFSCDILGRHWTCWEGWRTRRPRFKGKLWIQIFFQKGKYVKNVSEMQIEKPCFIRSIQKEAIFWYL